MGKGDTHKKNIIKLILLNMILYLQIKMKVTFMPEYKEH